MKNLSLILSTLGIAIIMYSCSWEKDSEKALEQHGKALRTVDASDEKEAMKEKEADLGNVKVNEIKINIHPKNNSSVSGTVEFKEENGEVFMVADLFGLQPGEHAIHLHENADCSSDDGKSAGGHWNPTNEKHGEWGSENGYHRGDIGNFVANEDGDASVKFATEEWCLHCDDDAKNIIGQSVVIHAGADDFTSQPSGSAGKRVGCGAIAQYR